MTGLTNGPLGVTGRLTLSMDGTDRFTEVVELGPDAGSLREFVRIDWERSGGEQAV